MWIDQKQPPYLFNKKKLLLKTLQDSQEKNLRRSIFLIKVPTQMFSCEYCEIFKNTFFEEHLRLLLNKHIIQDKKFWDFFTASEFFVSLDLMCLISKTEKYGIWYQTN